MWLRQAEAFEQARVCIACDRDPGRKAMAAAHAAARRIRLRPLRVSTGLSRGPAVRGGMTMRLVEGRKDADAMVRRLEKAGEDPDWLPGAWAKAAAGREGAVLVEVSARSGIPFGFIGFRRAAEVEVHEGGVLAFCYGVRPDYVYLAPHARGRGLSKALGRAVLSVVEADLRQMAELRDEGAFDGLRVGFEVMGQAESCEGAAFMEYLRQEIARRVEDGFPRGELEEMGYREVVRAF